MCGRYTLRSAGRTVAALFDLADELDLQARFNIAPTQDIPVVRANPQNGNRQLAFRRWGLVPSWAADPSVGNRMINARAETAAMKPAFRVPFRRRRCLVVCDGFYEWKRTGGMKQPYFITRQDGNPFGLAGLWDKWVKEGESIESSTILTTEANDLLRSLHDRMPVILQKANYRLWLDPSIQEPAMLMPLLRPYSGQDFIKFPVSSLVNNPRHEDARCVEPLPAGSADDSSPEIP